MRKKQSKKRFIILVIALLLLISVGYAAISTTLTINGTANIAATSWNVYFTNIQTQNGSVIPTVAPTVNGTNTTSLSYEIILEEPGDFYEFTVDVVNGGTINAKLNNITKTDLATENADAAKLVNYTVTYGDDSAIAVEDGLAKNGEVGSTKTIKVRVEYKTDITAEDLAVIGTGGLPLSLNLSLEYGQA